MTPAVQPSVPEGITFVVPCFNSGGYLRDAVLSLLAQPLNGPSEILVVDDGSDDADTLRAIQASRAMPGVRVLRSLTRRGHHSARNAGIEAAQYAFVMQLDADDRLATDRELLASGSYPDRAIDLLRADENLAFVHTMSWMIDGFNGYTISSYPCREDLVMSKHHVPTSIVCRRQDAVAGGLYDPRVLKWGDWGFAVNILGGRFRRGRSNSIACIPGPFHHYRMHTSSYRVSSAEVSELAMTALVVERNLDLFQDRLCTTDTAQDIARQVLARKPSRLEDLLHMAQFDLEQALEVARQRQFGLPSPYEHLGIP
ncbi:glycosyltransferase family A protein [Streptacidiphilus sp. P02-A3a]|uniref:glycosyltransferase family 2 protein n=1 Tax=Streptacidiphilus sp. P02-A3a TaxID=2704468 RepID=UPI0015FDCF09|nr:glycosyltransferase family A protein [Streptacidiphilus sp. P02-A3a]QMU67122.1 glycosyltransferase family 2 protein [Streptacidiphilus sp. P02-A3a]